MTAPLDVTPTFNNTNATSHLVSMPATVVAGDLLLMFYTSDGAPTITDVWTQLYKQAQGTVVSGACYAKIADGTEDGGTVDVATSASEAFAAQVYRYGVADWFGDIATGITVGTPLASANSGSNNPSTPAVNASWGSAANEFIVVMHNSTSATVSAIPSSYGDTVDTNSGGGTASGGVVTARRALSATGDTPGTWTTSVTGVATVTNSVVVRPAGTTTRRYSLSLTGVG